MRNHPRNIVIVSSLILLGLLTGGCASDQSVISNANQMNSQLKPAIIEDPELAGYLQKVGDRIIGSAKELDKQGFGPKTHKEGDNTWMFGNNMKFHFVNSKTVNAFTTGGDHMYVYNALFQMCRNEDELAAVMAHEYGHVYARHVAKGMNRQYGALAAAAALAGAGYVAGGKEHGSEYAGLGFAGGAAAGQFLNMGFTRKDEAEADKLGFTFFTHAGWEPDHFADFFRDMIKAGYDKTPAVASDHPTLASRVEASDKWVKELPPEAAQWKRPPIADESAFRQLQARANQVAKTTPDDTKIANSQQLLQALPRSCVMPYTAQDEQQARDALVKKAEAVQQQQQQGQQGQPTAAKKKKKRPPPADSATPASGSQVISSPSH